MGLSRGHALALEQLRDIEARSDGALAVQGDPRETSPGVLEASLSLATKAYRRPDGLRLRDRERLTLSIPNTFPLDAPTLAFDAPRHAGASHVNWGVLICLHQAPEAEWQPSDGLFGFVERMDEWFAAAGAGTLAPDDGPLHPPAVAERGGTTVVVRADAPGPIDDEIWLGFAQLREIRADRADLVGWSPLDEPLPAFEPDVECAVAILLPRPLPPEYPTRIDHLLDAVEGQGMAPPLLYRALRLAARLPRTGRPAHVVIGAPMRRRAAGEPLRQHVTVWEIAASDGDHLRDFVLHEADDDQIARMAQWMCGTPVRWCRTLESRAEVTHRRDRSAPSSIVRGAHVVLLGCGAIGSAVAEHLVRAGVGSLRLVDNGAVSPGVLVRQRYADDDVARPKATALAERLESLGLRCAVEPVHVDLGAGALATILAGAAPALVIDATASSRVAHRLESELGQGSLPCPLVSLAVSAGASHGSVAVRMPSYPIGPVQLNRQAKIAAFAADRAHPSVQAFWPEPGTVTLFQPEPGCSEPTFTGAAADIDHHAAGLLNIGLRRTEALDPNGASMDLVAASWVDLEEGEPTRLAYELAAPSVIEEHRHGYAVLYSPTASANLDAELRRNGLRNDGRDETGGVLFGSVDDAHRVIWIDDVTGPPSDSVASPDRFLCGTEGVVEETDRRRRRTAGSSTFVGLWHTHPKSPGFPSRVDFDAVRSLLTTQPETPRHTVMLIVGFAQSDRRYEVHLFRRGEWDDPSVAVDPERSNRVA